METRTAQGRFGPGNTTGGRRGQTIHTRLRQAKKDALDTIIEKSASGNIDAIRLLLSMPDK